jgi:apolipoprotein N-acyltransferase
MFLVLGRACRVEFGRVAAAILMPFLWTGFEYFRSELYYLRFSWLNAGYAFSDNLAWLPMGRIGVYGIGFLLMAAISCSSLLRYKLQFIASVALLTGLAVITNAPSRTDIQIERPDSEVQVAGVQLEFPPEAEVVFCLNKLIKAHPQAQLLLLSEYTFTGPVPESIKDWCRKNQRYLVVGAEDPAPDSQYYDTAFVIGPSGDIIFRQAKAVPIQFFKDGLPAKAQNLWESPWGRIGFCVCYDLSYSRVTDRLIRLGAQALIVPTMDVVDWGRHQHELHARVAPIRAAEYGVPIFRMASSGISQFVNANGQVQAIAPMPGDEAMIFGALRLARPGTLPWDRVVAPVSVMVTSLTVAWLLCVLLWRKRHRVIIKPAP